MKKTKYPWVFAHLILAVVFTAHASYAAADKIRIAILDLKADGVPGKTARTVGNMIRTDLVNTGKFTVVERTQMDLILKEQGFQQTGCTDQECAVQIGKVLSARKMLIGEVSEVEGALYMTIRIVDVERGEIDYAEKEVSAPGERMDAAITRLTDKLTKRIAGEKPLEIKIDEKKLAEERRLADEKKLAEKKRIAEEKRLEKEKKLAEKKRLAEEKKRKKESEPARTVVHGDAPAGLTVSFGCYLPLAADFSDSYSLLYGGNVGYLYLLSKNLALNGNVFFLTGGDDSGDARATFTGAVLGARAGLPLFGFMYPYLGAAARGSLIYEKGKSDAASFFAWGFDGLAGVAFMVSASVAINVECAYSFARVADEAGTDVSGLAISGGVILKLW